MKISKRLIALMLITALALCGCKRTPANTGAPVTIDTPEIGEPMSKAEDFNAARREFAYKLLRGCYQKGGNTLVSPLSVQTAVALLANGARGDTLTEIQNAVLGGLKKIVVAEHNCGQIVLEVERLVRGACPVAFVGMWNGTVITPQEILQKVEEA